MRPLLVFIGITLVVYGMQDGAVGLIFFGLFMIGVPVNTPAKAAPVVTQRSLWQALDMEADLIEEDYESEIRAVKVEFLHRPLTAASIAELESEVWLALTRRDEASARLEQRAGLASPTPPCPPGS